MLLLKYILFGIIQGFCEPLPISSSGHLRIIKLLFNSDVLNDMNLEIIVNFGSLIAVIILYKNQIITIIKDFFMYLKTKKDKYKTNYIYSWLIIIGTVPACILGLLLKDFIEENSNVKSIGLMFIFTSILLYTIKDITGKKNKKDISIKDAIKIGLFQSIALFPGVSRSGSTIVGAMSCDLTRQTAIDYSFMLYIPISFVSFLLGISDLINSPNLNNLFIPYIVSMIVSGIMTYFSLKLFINIMKKGKLIYFSIYCFIIGIITFIVF